MKHFFTIVMVSVIALVVYASVDWSNLDLSLSTLPEETAIVSGQSYNDVSSEDTVENDIQCIDTVMYAEGHAFRCVGDISMLGGWYLDTIFVGDENMLRYDSVGPSSLRLSLITRELLVDLGDKDVADKIIKFLNPINGFRRFQQNYEECFDSVADEKYGTWKYIGEFSFTVDYPDSSMANASKINRFICALSGISENEKAKAPGLAAFCAGFKPTKNYRPVYTGNINDMKCLSDFLAHKTFENWIRGGEFGMTPSVATLEIKSHIANERFVTVSMYECERVGPGHGMYTESFHTFDFNTEKELKNTDIFKSQYFSKVKMKLFEVMSKDPYYRAWNGESITASEIQGKIEGWQSPDHVLEGTEWEETEREVKFELPDGALTDSGVVFSFQPYEIDCWTAGTYHFIVPYKQLIPYMTQKAKRLISASKSK